MANSSFPFRHIRSFSRRDSRMTSGQQLAFEKLWPVLGLKVETGKIDLTAVFGRDAPSILEIGFGSGQSLAALAAQFPEYNFVGIETFRPGIGALFLQVEALQLTNIRVYYHDAVEVINQCIPDDALNGIQIFFPDPWQKRRHHKRRLIQEEFIKKTAAKLKPDGLFHLATDWEDYAIHMMRVLSAEKMLHNVAGIGQFTTRSPHRPLVTKFEGRGETEGRPIWDLQFTRQS